jgi:hypothetical protein
MNLIEHLELYECHLVEETTSHEELRALNNNLPTDVHLVRYWPTKAVREQQAEAAGLPVEDLIAVSGIRAYKMSDIFDGLTDAGFEVLEITQGYGRIRPNLYGIQGVAEA